AYIEPTSATVSDTLENAARKNSSYLTYLAPFSYKVNRDGSLTPPPLNQLASIAHTNNTSLMLTVTNLEGVSLAPNSAISYSPYRRCRIRYWTKLSIPLIKSDIPMSTSILNTYPQKIETLTTIFCVKPKNACPKKDCLCLPH